MKTFREILLGLAIGTAASGVFIVGLQILTHFVVRS
jgi:hypothetical protein